MDTPNVPTPQPVATPDANAAANAKPNEGLTPAEIRKYKIGDQEYDEQTLRQKIEKGDGADRKFQEVAAQRKEIEKVLYQLKTNPGKVLLNKALGHNPANVMREIIKEAGEAGYDLKDLKQTLSEVMYEWIQEEQLDPKERENRQLKKQLEKIELEKTNAKQESERKLMEDLTQKAFKTLDEDITTALKTSGLPKSTFTVKRTAYYLDQAFKLKQEYEAQGIKMRDPKASDVLPFVRKDYETSFRELYQSADVETLIKLIGEQNVDKIRQYDVTRFKKGGEIPKNPGSPAAPKAPSTSGAKKPLNSAKNFFKQREEEIRALEKGQ